MRVRTRPLFAVLAGIIAIGRGSAPSAAVPARTQAEYTYTVIAADALAGGTLYEPSINNAGQVAFTAGGAALRGDGGPLTTIYGNPGNPGPFANGPVSINGAGVVAMSANSFVLGTFILAGDGTAQAATVASALPNWFQILSPSINDAGEIVYEAVTSTTRENYVLMGSTMTPIVSPGDPAPGGTTITGAQWAKINNVGDVAFIARLSDGSNGVFRKRAGQIVYIAPFMDFGMNDAGVIAVFKSATANSPTQIVASDGVTETVIAANATGFFVEPHRTAINNFGLVAYMAGDGSGLPSAQGIWVGDGTITRQVLHAGDVVPGLGTILDVLIENEAINDAGQVAIRVRYDDGSGVDKYGIVRADPANSAPVAQNNGLSTDEDTPATGNLSASDADGDPLSYSIVTNGTLGTAAITNAATGAFTYTPDANVSGADTFTFKVNDGTVDSNVATISVTIGPVNDTPVGQDGANSTTAGTPVSGTLVATDIDSATLTYSIVTNGSLGIAVVTNATTGAYSYTPAAGQSGSDTFTFKANDGSVDSNTATITVTISPSTNRPPVATDDSLNTDEDRAARGRVSATDPDGQVLTFSLVTSPTKGTVALTSAGRFTYTPNANATGADGFTFRASDGIATSNTGTVTINIAPINDAPVVTESSITTTSGTPITAAFPASDVDGDALTFVVTRASRGGTIAVNANGTFTYTPNAGFTGSDSFRFRASDGQASSAQATVSITVR